MSVTSLQYLNIHIEQSPLFFEVVALVSDGLGFYRPSSVNFKLSLSKQTEPRYPNKWPGYVFVSLFFLRVCLKQSSLDVPLDAHAAL